MLNELGSGVKSQQPCENELLAMQPSPSFVQPGMTARVPMVAANKHVNPVLAIEGGMLKVPCAFRPPNVGGGQVQGRALRNAACGPRRPQTSQHALSQSSHRTSRRDPRGLDSCNA